MTKTNMVGIIGYKRLVVLFSLLGINAFFGGSMYLYTWPEQENSKARLVGLESEVSTLQTDIQRIRVEFQQLEKQKGMFEGLKKSGFFSLQMRSEAKQKFKEIQVKSGVISAVATVEAGVVEDNEEATKAKHKILVSPVVIDIQAFDDADIYRYIYILDHEFPGHISVDNVMITRTKDVSAPVLRAIATGMNPELVRAKIEMSWRTMIPEVQVIEENKG